MEGRYETVLAKGLAISLNKIPLQARVAELSESNSLKPAYKELSISPTGDEVIRVRIYAGVTESSPRDAGWYVFCNGRLVLQADKTSVTGWGESSPQIPSFHNQFARFRGYVFLDSADAGLLPWNTAKTGVQADSSTYLAIRLHMVTMMRPVIDFLNALKEDLTGEEFEVTVGRVDKKKLSAFEGPERAFYWKPAASPPVRQGRVSYQKPLEEINRVKASLGATTNKEVGERTFDYYLKVECDD